MSLCESCVASKLKKCALEQERENFNRGFDVLMRAIVEDNPKPIPPDTREAINIVGAERQGFSEVLKELAVDRGCILLGPSRPYAI